MFQLFKRTKLKRIVKYAKFVSNDPSINLHVIGAGGGCQPPSVILSTRNLDKGKNSIFFNYPENCSRALQCLMLDNTNMKGCYKYIFMTRNWRENAQGITDIFSGSSTTSKVIAYGPEQILEFHKTQIMKKPIYAGQELHLYPLDSNPTEVSQFKIDHVVMNPSRSHTGNDTPENSPSQSVPGDLAVAYIVKSYCSLKMLGNEKESTLVKNDKAKAAIWDNFRLKKENGKVLHNFAICVHCNKPVKLAGGTSNLSNHMRRHHSHLRTEQAVQGSSVSSKTSSEMEKRVKSTQPTLSLLMDVKPNTGAKVQELYPLPTK